MMESEEEPVCIPVNFNVLEDEVPMVVDPVRVPPRVTFVPATLSPLLAVYAVALSVAGSHLEVVLLYLSTCLLDGAVELTEVPFILSTDKEE